MKKTCILGWSNRIIISAIMMVFLSNCQEFPNDEPQPQNSVPQQELTSWKDMLDSFDLSRDIVLVQKNNSIQEAIDAAKPGDAIYIEPGTYREALTINKDNLKLIGLNGADNEKVILENPGGNFKCLKSTGGAKDVEIVNVIPKNFNEVGFPVAFRCAPAPAGTSRLLSMERSEIQQGLVHYQFTLRVGKGSYDVIKLHRVVREIRPYHPVKTNGNVFMLHGGFQNFSIIYLTAGANQINAKTSSPVYLASKNVDVWGIDLAWSLVPAETTDFSFMKGWGIDKDIDHILAAMSFARLIRGLSNHDFDKMNLLGFSNTVPHVYGAAGRETQLPACLRNMKGMIPVDTELKCSDEPWAQPYREEICAAAAAFKESIANGIYQYGDGATFIYLADLALTAPDDPSPIFEGLTNYKAVMALGTMTSPNWHFVGGDLNGLYYSDMNRFLNLLHSLVPNQPAQVVYDMYECSCNKNDVVSFDDHVGEIKLPLLYIGARGGAGAIGICSTHLTASTDITSLLVSVSNDQSIDYGHADLWIGENADRLVWEPLRKWLVSHN